MVNKYCFIITASPYYILGINSILNALEYYGHKDIDVVLMHPEPMVPYYEYVKDKFSFPIIGARVEDWDDDTMLDQGGNVYIDMSHTWAEFQYIGSIKDKYEAICMMDADMLLLGNVMQYLKIAAGTDLLLIPHNVRAAVWLEDRKYFKRDIDAVRAYLVEHWIFFFSPKHNIDVINYVWNNRFNNLDRPNIEDREPQEELYLLNKALFDLGKVDQVLQLPGSLWSSGEHFHIGRLELKTSGDFGLVSSTGDTVFSVHSRWWNKNITKHQVTSAGFDSVTSERLKHNAELGEQAINLFNYKGRVTIDQIRALSPDYHEALDSYEKIHY